MKKQSIWQRAVATATALAIGLAGVPATALAEDASAQAGGTVTLQVAFDQDGDGTNDLVVNKSYKFYGEKTLGDLFAAAKSAGDVQDYAFGDNGYLDSVTTSDGSEVTGVGYSDENFNYWGTYWASYKNGVYAQGISDCQEVDTLTDGTAFQFQIEGYSSTDPAYGPTALDWAATPEPTLSSQQIGEPSDPAPEPTPAKAYPYDAATAAALRQNLAARFAKGGSDASLSNSTIDGAIALNALGLGSQIDSAALLKSFEGYEETTGYAPGAGQYGKYVLALTAAGVDCTKVTFSDGTTHNLVSEMEALLDAGTAGIYDEVWILPVYRSYADASGHAAAVIDDILSSADSDGLFGSLAFGCDSQTTAEAILALLPYRSSRSDVRAAVEKAEAALLSMQNEDGGFDYMSAYPGSNLDATAEIVAALTALGHDCATGAELTTANGSTPLGWLCGMADANLAGFLDASSYNEAMTSAAVLMGLSADAGRQAAGGAYDVFALKAVSEAPAPAPEPTPQPEPQPEPAPKADDGSKPLPATSDATAPIAACGLAAAGALLLVESRRRAA